MSTLTAYVEQAARDLWHSEEALTYLSNRGVTREDILEFRLGYTEEGDPFFPSYSVIIPTFDYHGGLISATANLLRGKPKYWHHPFAVSNWLWGLHLGTRPNKPPVLCEGQFDAITLRRIGWPAYAVLGSKLGMWQAAHCCYLACHRKVIIFPDQGNPGFVVKGAEVLKGFGITVLEPPAPYLLQGDEVTDPDDLCRNDPARVNQILTEAQAVCLK